MKFIAPYFIVTLMTIVVSARKPEFTSTSSEDSLSKELANQLQKLQKLKHTYYEGSSGGKLDLQGTLRRKFAIEAAITDTSKNMACSPLSGLFPLAKLGLGADGKTLSEILTAIGVGSQPEISTFKSLISGLQRLSGVTLDLAFRVYLSKGKSLKSKFCKRAKSIFSSCVEYLDFSKPADSARTMNAWVHRETKGVIKEIITPDEISPSASMILVNAIYFNGKWDRPFHETTSTYTFYSPQGKHSASMMTQTGQYMFSENSSLRSKIILIPYKNKDVNFMIILPNERNGLYTLLSDLRGDPKRLDSAMKGLTDQRVKVAIPEFSIHSHLDLGVLYEKVGIKEMFRGHGLKHIVKDTTTYISLAVQRTVFKVTRGGTVAAAASMVQAQGISLSLSYIKEQTFIADHPFLFFVIASDQQLFSGIVVRPSK